METTEIITTEKIRIYIDASSLKKISCFRDFYNTVIKGLRLKGDTEYKMAYGSAIHKFLESYYHCKGMRASIEEATNYYRPWHDKLPFSKYEFRYITNLIKTCKAYAAEWPRHYGDDQETQIKLNPGDFIPRLGHDNKNAVEFKFVHPLWSNDKFELLLTGTVDLASSYAGIDLLLVDHKSTALAIGKADDFFDGYVMDIQTMLYSWVYKQKLGLDFYPPVMINGIFISKPTEKAEKAGIFDGVEFKRSGPIQYSDVQMNEIFLPWFTEKVNMIIGYLDTDVTKMYDNFNLAACKSGFSTCCFFDVCKLPRMFHEGALENRYRIEQYNPLKFR